MKWSAVNNNTVEFLLADLQTAHTFMDLAETTGNEETRKRNHRKARHAYDTVTQLLQKVKMHATQLQAIEDKLASLEKRLQAVGC